MKNYEFGPHVMKLALVASAFVLHPKARGEENQPVCKSFNFGIFGDSDKKTELLLKEQCDLNRSFSFYWRDAFSGRLCCLEKKSHATDTSEDSASKPE